MANSDRKTELLVGLFLFVGLLLLGGLILQFSALGDRFKTKYPLTVRFEDATGVNRGVPVKLAGAKVGRVAATPELTEDFRGVVVELEIFKGVEIPVGSEFSVGSSGLMGDSLIQISPPSQPTDEFIPAGTELDGAAPGGLGALGDVAEDLSAKTGEVLSNVQATLEQLTGAVETLDAGFLGTENAEHFALTLDRLQSAIGKIDEKVLAEENSENITATVADLRSASADFKAMAASLREATTGVGLAVEDARSAMTKLDAAAEEIVKAAQAATTLMESANEGDGLAAALIHDAALREDFTAFVESLRTRGVLFYKDVSGREDPDAAPTQAEIDDAIRRGWRPR